MLFSSIGFLYLFLPIVLGVYYLAPRKWRNGILLIASLAFYFYGEPKYTVLLLISSLSDYLHSLMIEKYRGRPAAKGWLISSIVINLAMLGVFKYTDFFIATLNSLTGASIPLVRLELPIGISFFTFQTMSYTIDVYRGRVKAQKNLLHLATYVCLFPQLVAGPIVRYSTVAEELVSRNCTPAGFSRGVLRFCVGLGKKVLLANTLGQLWESLNGSAPTVLGYWLMAIAYTLQIYFDFSGYSDMAIGLGAMFGFTFPENFDHPFTSRSVTEFWRRWHMTLGGWFRDYVYIPLGGNRVSVPRWILNLMIVWALTGLWHGAQWNFVLWGLYFGVLLGLEKLFIGKLLQKIPAVFGLLYTLIITLFSFVIFSNDTVAAVWAQLAGMFSGSVWSAASLYYLKSYVPVLLVAAVGSTALPLGLANRLAARKPRLAAWLQPLLAVCLLLLCTAYLVDSSYNPFLYFRF